MSAYSDEYSVVGIGFGPSNLSLAIALDEHNGKGKTPLAATFVEQQAAFGWHRNMLLPTAKMQISFLKDLATFRNPVSQFSFISYLHEAGRLAQFVNNQDFMPTRREFHDYLTWAASNFSDRVAYNSRVTAVQLPDGAGHGPMGHLKVKVDSTLEGGGSKELLAKNVVISTGLVPKMPPGIDRDERVWHSSEFLGRFGELDKTGVRRVAVVGAGQSAAEILRYCYEQLPGAQVSAIMPSYGYSIADDTPFANQIFDADAVDDYFHGTARARDSFWRYHRNTNYGVADDEIIRDLYQRAYSDEVAGTPRLNFLNLSRVDAVKQVGDEVRVTLQSVRTDETQDMDFDVLIFSTGYESMDPTELLGDAAAYCLRDEEGRFQISRDYRILTTDDLDVGIYLQGGTEHTHGLGSSLLSNIAIRSGEIVESLAARGQSMTLRPAA
ncbi:lysine N(6)-hydroxylase/L-ornithine N(5)-oxygenase family protein [Streptomyces sp. NPDC059009]|uniref:lysine N(6)-hydroxylase/L-ornithine N(5)-oxygenase family protein n=1 Tax=Streptomyces sp. NPDC059009 TaxID=3346694 RepID=UPI003689F751